MKEQSKHPLTITVQSVMDEALIGLEQRREKPRAFKQGLMQELLTSGTRLL